MLNPTLIGKIPRILVFDWVKNVRDSFKIRQNCLCFPVAQMSLFLLINAV